MTPAQPEPAQPGPASGDDPIVQITDKAFDVRTTGTHLVMPPFADIRSNAVAMAACLPDDLTVREVTIDANLSLSASQDFVDELVKQIFEVRHAESIAISGSGGTLSRHFRESAIRRRFTGQVFVQAREI
jgi:hypothetical protein